MSNQGYLGRTINHYYPFGEAGCDKKHLDALHYLWKKNIWVCATDAVCFD